jgi:hypothetical protein
VSGSPAECYFDQKLNAMVHRFGLGAEECACGKTSIPKKPDAKKGSPWRHQAQPFGHQTEETEEKDE